EVRDRSARDDYVREEGRMAGMAEGKAEGKAEGELKGMADAVLQLLAEKGPVSRELEQAIRRQKNLEILNLWHLSAARAESVEAFLREAQIAEISDVQQSWYNAKEKADVWTSERTLS
ncbi:MAG: hypothetical protein NC541_15625, partial [bacterium]|nr:hypothetical protein [bacterium]